MYRWGEGGRMVNASRSNTFGRAKEGKIIVVIISAVPFFSGGIWEDNNSSKAWARRRVCRKKEKNMTQTIFQHDVHPIDAPPDTLQMTVPGGFIAFFSRFLPCGMSRRDLFIIKEKYLIWHGEDFFFIKECRRGRSDKGWNVGRKH